MSNPSLTIAVDAMGGDHGPRITVPATVKFAEASPYSHLILVGDTTAISTYLPQRLPPNLEVHDAPSVVTMMDKPAQVLRSGQDTSLWISIKLVADGHADACVSAGNTGALMAVGRHLLRTFPGIDRPAICKPIPTHRGHSYMLDLGANVDCPAEQLLQFALMGSELASAIDGLREPRVCLLNIGAESTKGNDEVRLAADLLTNHEHLNYVGFIEGHQIYQGEADVVVCDGFVGNVALKVSEGVVRFLATELKASIESTLLTKLAGLIVRPVLRKWHTKFDPGRYNGACFLGLQAALVKSHGSADAETFGCALRIAQDQVLNQIPQRIHSRLTRVLVTHPSGNHNNSNS